MFETTLAAVSDGRAARRLRGGPRLVLPERPRADGRPHARGAGRLHHREAPHDRGDPGRRDDRQPPGAARDEGGAAHAAVRRGAGAARHAAGGHARRAAGDARAQPARRAADRGARQRPALARRRRHLRDGRLHGPRHARDRARAAARGRGDPRRRARLRLAVAGARLPLGRLHPDRGPVRRRRHRRPRRPDVGRRGDRVAADHAAARRRRDDVARAQRRDPAGRQPVAALVARAAGRRGRLRHRSRRTRRR